MKNFCEKIVNIFNFIFWGDKISNNDIRTKEKVEYTLSSVFPTQEIMIEAKKYF